MTAVKPGGMLDKLMNAPRATVGICETCGNLVRVSDNALGCAAHDKLIMPEYPPYHGNSKCADWRNTESEGTV